MRQVGRDRKISDSTSEKAKGLISICADTTDMCVPFHIVSNCYFKIFYIFYVIKDSSLYIIESIDLFDPFP